MSPTSPRTSPPPQPPPHPYRNKSPPEPPVVGEAICSPSRPGPRVEASTGGAREPPDPPVGGGAAGALRDLVRDPQLLAGQPHRTTRRRARQHTCPDPPVRHTSRTDHHGRRCGGRQIGAGPRRQRRQVRTDLPDRRPVRPHHRLLHVRVGGDPTRADRVGRTHRRHVHAAGAGDRGHPEPQQRQLGRAAPDRARRHAAGRQVPAGAPRGLDRPDRDRHRGGDLDVELPQLRPQPGCRPRLRRRLRLRDRTARRRSRSVAGQRLSAAVHARVDVQGPHHRRCARRRRDLARQLLGARARVRASPDHRPDHELRRNDLWRRHGRGVPPLVQHAIRPDRPRPRPRSVSGGHRAMGRRSRRSRSTCPVQPPARSATSSTSTRTSHCCRCVRSGRTTTKWCRSTWRWSPPRSPTTGR